MAKQAPEYDDDGRPLNKAAEDEDAFDTACLIAAMRGEPEPRTAEQAHEIVRQSRERAAKREEAESIPEFILIPTGIGLVKRPVPPDIDTDAKLLRWAASQFGIASTAQQGENQ